MEKTKVLSRRIHIPQARDNGVVNDVAPRTSEALRCIRGTHTYVQPSEWTGQHPSLNVPINLNGTSMCIIFSFIKNFKFIIKL